MIKKIIFIVILGGIIMLCGCKNVDYDDVLKKVTTEEVPIYHINPEINTEVYQELMKVYNNGWDNAKTLDFVMDKIGIQGIRKISDEIFYTGYVVNKNHKLFIFFDKDSDNKLRVFQILYLQDVITLNKEDFEQLVVGFSTFSDVTKTDPYFIPYYLSINTVTEHILNDGRMVKITYDDTEKISKIEYLELSESIYEKIQVYDK